MRGKVRKTINTTTIFALQTYKDPETGNYETQFLTPTTINGKVTPNQAPGIVAKRFVLAGELKENATIIIDRIIEGKTTYEMDIETFIVQANISTN